MTPLDFYRWFLAELLAALRGMQLDVEHAEDATIIAPSGTNPGVTSAAGTRRLRGQSNLAARPRQRVTSGVTFTGEWLLGDGTRIPPILDWPRPGSVIITTTPPPVDGWLPPVPVMPPQAAGTSIAWTGPQHAAIAFFPADDGLWDAGYTRETGTGWCPPLPTGASPVEPSGVMARDDRRRCLADNKARPEHLNTAARPNMRLPVMQGIDATGPYTLEIDLPLKTFEYRRLEGA